MRQRGFLVRRGHALEVLSSADHIIFDKTGTLTLGNMSISQVLSLAEMSEQQLLQLAAGLESGSLHPISRAFSGITDKSVVSNVEQKVGAGISGWIVSKGIASKGVVAKGMTSKGVTSDGGFIRVAIGRPGYIAELFGFDQPEFPTVDSGELPLLLADERQLLGWILLKDQLRPGAAQAISQLKEQGLAVSLFSGDRQDSVSDMAATLGIGSWCGGMSPEQKLAEANKLQQLGHRVVMVGDGINDVPVLSGADVSVAMGDATDFARIHADSIMLSSHLDGLPKAITIARATRRVIRQNLTWALVYNLVALPLAAAGMIPPWAAAIGMSASSLLVVLNALRLNRFRLDTSSFESRGA